MDISLPNSFLTDMKSVFDSMIATYGKPCRLVYAPVWTPCGNCVASSIGQKSSNRYKHGGPVPFKNGTTCPLCNGSGQKSREVTEDVTWLTSWQPRQFFYPVPHLDVRVPYSIVQTKGLLTDLPKALRCEHLVFQTNIEGVSRQEYKLAHSPGDPFSILQDRYFAATWERQ